MVHTTPRGGNQTFPLAEWGKSASRPAGRQKREGPKGQMARMNACKVSRYGTYEGLYSNLAIDGEPRAFFFYLVRPGTPGLPESPPSIFSRFLRLGRDASQAQRQGSPSFRYLACRELSTHAVRPGPASCDDDDEGPPREMPSKSVRWYVVVICSLFLRLLFLRARPRYPDRSKSGAKDRRGGGEHERETNRRPQAGIRRKAKGMAATPPPSSGQSES